MAWPKEIVAVFTMPSHFWQSGSLPAPRKAFLIGSSSWRWPQSRAACVGRVAVQLDDLRIGHARALMQAVDVLGDDGGHASLLDQLGERAMAGIGLGLEHGLVGGELAPPGFAAHLLDAMKSSK